MTAPVRDRRSLALQIRDGIRGLIVADGLGPGDQLPSEADLSARFAVGRTTVREALKLLEQDGVIDVRHGLGRFVATAGVKRPITRLESVTEMMAALGYEVQNRVLGVEESPASPDEAQALELEPRTPVVRLQRLRLQGDEPLIYSVDVMARTLFSEPIDSIDWSGSLQALLMSRGMAMVSAIAQIKAVHLPEGIAERLGRDPAEPWLLLIQLNSTRTGRRVIYSYDYHRGDAFSFNVLRRAEI